MISEFKIIEKCINQYVKENLLILNENALLIIGKHFFIHGFPDTNNFTLEKNELL